MENPYAPPSRDAERRPGDERRPGQGPGRAPRAPGSPRPPRPPRPPVPAPDPEALRTVQRRIGVFLVLIIASLLTSRLRLPWQLGGLAFSLVAFGTGVWALVAARRPGLRERLAPMLVVGLAFTTMLALSMSSSLLLWSEQLEHQECLDNALTLSTRAACDQAYQDAVERRLERLTNPGAD